MRFTEVNYTEIGDIKFQENDTDSDPNCWLFTFRTKKMRELTKSLE